MNTKKKKVKHQCRYKKKSHKKREKNKFQRFIWNESFQYFK